MTPIDPLVEAIVAGVVERLSQSPLREAKRSRLTDIDGAAEYLGRTPTAIRRLIGEGKIKAVRIDGRVQLDIHDLDRVIEESKT